MPDSWLGDEGQEEAQETRSEEAAVGQEPEAAQPAGPELSSEVSVKASELEERIKSNPSSKAPYLQLAQTYLDAGRKDLAIETFKRYLTIDPDNAYIANRIQVLLGKAKATKPVAYTPPVDAAAMQQAHHKAKKILLYAGAGVVLVIAALLLKPVLLPSAKPIFVAKHNGYCPKWSPRGDAIAFCADKSGGGALCLFDVKKNSVRELTELEGYSYGGRSLAWSPDGLEIAYESYVSDEGLYGQAVFVINVENGEKRRVATGRRPSWSPVERSLALISSGERRSATRWSRREEVETVCVADIVTQGVRKLTNQPADNPSFSPVGNQIVFEVPVKVDWKSYEEKLKESGGGRDQGVDLADIMENALSSGATTDLEAKKGLAREMETIEHDKGSGENGGADMILDPSNIYIVDGHGLGLTPLTTDNRCGSPMWTSDGKMILYTYYPPGSSRGEIWMMRPDGTEKHQVLRGELGVSDPSSIALTPDHKRVIFENLVEDVNPAVAAIISKSSPTDLFLADLGGTNLKRLKNKHAFKHRFSLSPDGKKIAYEFINADTNTIEIWMMSL